MYDGLGGGTPLLAGSPWPSWDALCLRNSPRLPGPAHCRPQVSLGIDRGCSWHRTCVDVRIFKKASYPYTSCVWEASTTLYDEATPAALGVDPQWCPAHPPPTVPSALGLPLLRPRPCRGRAPGVSYLEHRKTICSGRTKEAFVQDGWVDKTRLWESSQVSLPAAWRAAACLS